MIRHRLPLLLLLAIGCGPKSGGTTTAQREIPVEEGVLLDDNGALAEGDLRVGQGFADHFEVAVREGDRITIELTSVAFDPLLEVTPPGSGPMVNDDWQGDRQRSRVDFVAASAGVIKVRVTSYAPGATGEYRIRVLRAEEQAAGGAAPVIQMSAVLVPGQSLEGQLIDGDATLSDGAFYDQLNVEVTGGAVDLRVEGMEGAPPRVEVQDPQGRSLRPSSPGVFSLVEPGVHRTVIAAAATGQQARYRASAAVRGGAAVQASLSREDHRSPSDQSATAVRMGQRVQGELRSGDSQLPSGELADVYLLEGRAGTAVSLELRSDAFDSYLLVEGPGGRRWENDDAGGGLHAALAFPLPADGSYRIVATSYREGETGAYELKVFEDGREVTALAPPAPTPGAGPAPVASGPLRRSGALSAGDAQLGSGEYLDRYTFVWQAGQRVRIAASSSEIDTYLILRTPSGRQEDNDDVESGNTNSLIEWEVTETGPHSLIVTSYQPRETGAYELSIDGGGAASTVATTTAPSTTVQHGGGFRTITGALQPGDQQLRTGEFFDAHPFEWPSGQTVHLEARSSEFDSYLIVHPPGGHQQDNDDQSPGNTNAALDLVTTEAGAHQVVVTSYRPGEQGRYELLVGEPTGGATVAQPGPTPTSGPTPTPAGVVGAGHEIRGELAEGDATLRAGELSDVHTLRFNPGQALRLTLDSERFDTYLIVRTPGGRQIDNDDVVSGNLNSAVDLPRTENGDYTVTVTSYAPNETGPYALRIVEGTAVPGPAVTTGGGHGGGGGGGGGQVFGVFAGITDYPGGVNDLPECANDAVKLAQTLRQQGLLTEDRQILLTDGQATRANIRDAMRRMAQRVGPNDVFVFFYSGHGGRHDERQSSDRREIDGHDEYIFVHDGEILDDEMGTLFDGINARLAVLSLDACFAGGFAKDVITRPGRIGLFSSEEDVTSAVAGAFRAGGYLSHFLRTGFSGEADVDPSDGVLTVGELTHYLTLQFGQNVRDVRMTEGYQHLVVDRGAVGTRQVLWAYR